MESVTRSPSQQGYSTDGGGFAVFTEGVADMPLRETGAVRQRIGLVWSGLAPNGPVFGTVQVRVVVSVRDVGIGEGQGLNNCALYLVRQDDPAAWADANLPPAPAVDANERPTDESAYVFFGEAEILNTVGHVMTFSADMDYDQTLGFESAGVGFVPYYQGANWSGELSFILKRVTATGNIFIASDTHATLDGPQLITTEVPANSGLDGVRGNSRVDRCPVCGFRSLRETWVMDGYRKRLVCPECWDPKDRMERPLIIRPEDRFGINDKG